MHSLLNRQLLEAAEDGSYCRRQVPEMPSVESTSHSGLRFDHLQTPTPIPPAPCPLVHFLRMPNGKLLEAEAAYRGRGRVKC